jgi:DNA damage-inducible protein 1
MDTRFAGMAQGIGTSRILGRVHAVDVKILDQTFVFSFTILEDNKVDMLLGLDNLKRHQCQIDLVDNVLRMKKGDFMIPFLSDGEVEENKMQQEAAVL